MPKSASAEPAPAVVGGGPRKCFASSRICPGRTACYWLLLHGCEKHPGEVAGQTVFLCRFVNQLEVKCHRHESWC